MPKSYLWGLDENSNVFSLSSWDNYWQKIDCNISKINKFQMISPNLWSLWSIGSDNQIYLYVPEPEITIRTFDVIIENQKKELGRYNGKNLKDQDPPEFSASNYYGKLVKSDLKSFSLPSTRWKWEDVWKIKKSINGEFIEEGWIYSSSFLQKFQNIPNRLSNSVRRRYWQRYRYFDATQRWLLINQDNEPFEITCNQEGGVDLDSADECVDYSNTGVIDIGCGGEMLPHQKDGFVSVWTINEDGQVLYRLDVHRQNPEGSHWCLVKLPKYVRATCLNVGPLGHLLVCSSQGLIYFRENITWKNPIGSSWSSFNPPEDLIQGERIIQLTSSVYAIWLRSSNNRVWFRSGVNMHELNTCLAIGTSWMISGYNVTWISSSPSGQLWGLSLNGNGVLYRFSSNIVNKNERFWSGFLHLGFGFGEEVKSTRLKSICSEGLFLEDDRMPPVWLQSPVGSRSISTKNIVQDLDWKMKIVASLVTRDYEEFKNPFFSNYISLPEQLSWSKASYCEAQSLVSINALSRWLPANAILHHKLRDNKDLATLHVNFTRVGRPLPNEASFLESNEILCVSKYSSFSIGNVNERCTTLVTFIQKKRCSSSQDSDHEIIPRLLLKFSSEIEVEDWILALNFVMRADKRNYIGRTDLGKIWFLNKFYEPFHFYLNEKKEPLTRCYQNGGHFKMVESCAKGRVTWALGFNGIAWVNSNGWGGSYLGLICSSKDDLYNTFDVKTIAVYEYEKLNLMPRFTSGQFSHYMWTDEYNNVIINKDCVMLSSRRWQWCGEWTVDHRTRGTNCDQEGWQYATSCSQKFDDNLTWSKSFRRRRWTRSYKTNTIGPWQEVLNDKMVISDISLATEPSDNYKCSILAVTETGLLLHRKGVTISYPEGLEWSQLRTDLKIMSVSVNKEGDLWVVCKYGSVWRLNHNAYKDTTRINSRDWELVKHKNVDGKFIKISSGDRLSVWAIDSNYHLWTRQFKSITNPSIGECWTHVCDQIKHVSSVSQDKVFVIFCKGCVAERMGISTELPQGTHWRYSMGDIASYISVRGA